VVADVGSGAGLPGIPLALARADVTVVLVEPLLRRATFLSEVVADLGLANARVVRARAEDLVPRRGSSARRGAERTSGSSTDADEVAWQPVDVVTSRAVAPLDRLAGWCAPLLRPGGSLVAMKGLSAADELRSARPALDRLGLTDVEVVTVGAGVVDPPTIVIRGILRDPGTGDSSRTSRRSSPRPAGGARRGGPRPGHSSGLKS
jgi:16S rRNA (guanine527-N7)-methyltransferase